MAALPAIAITLPASDAPLNGQIASAEQLQQLLEFPGVFKGHELTRKDGRLMCGIGPLDALLGGIARGRISEVVGAVSSGKTTVAAAFASAASRRGEVVGWVDVPGAFDPRSLEAAGADLARILWVSFAKRTNTKTADAARRTFINKERERRNELKAAELILEAGGFGLVIIDFGAMRFPLSQSASLRLARAAERSGTAVLALATNRVCGTFAALTLAMSKHRASFSRMNSGAPALFDGLRLEASVERNKLGLFGDRANLFAAVDPLSTIPLHLQSRPLPRLSLRSRKPGEHIEVPLPHFSAGREAAEAERSGVEAQYEEERRDSRSSSDERRAAQVRVLTSVTNFARNRFAEVPRLGSLARDDRTEEREGATSLVPLH